MLRRSKKSQREKPEIRKKERMSRQTRLKKSTIWIGDPTPPFTDDYVIGTVLGRGAYGTTYRVERKSDGKMCAAKIISKAPFYRLKDTVRTRRLKAIKNEIDILSTLRHPNVVKLEGIYEDKFSLYIVMEELKGGELIQRITQRKMYTERDASFVMKQILVALKYMHEVNNIVHCDLKPSNIMFATSEEKSLIKVIDFGMSKALPRFHYMTHLCGSLYYIAPEIITKKKYNHQCDMWSLGVMMFVMLFGYAPFWADSRKYGNRERSEIYKQITQGFVPRVRKGYGRWFPSHIPVSSEAKDLMKHLMDSNPALRYTANDALHHPWIIHSDKRHTALPSQTLTCLARFHNSNQLKLAVTRLFRSQFKQMRPQHFAQLQQSFRELDSNGDGVITYTEFEKAITQSMSKTKNVLLEKKHIQAIFAGLNTDEARGIRFESLLDAVVHDYLVACDERLYNAFQELDTDEDGFITVQELHEKLKELDVLGAETQAAAIIQKERLVTEEGKIDFVHFLQRLHPSYEEVPQWLESLHRMRPVRTMEEEEENQSEQKRN